MLIEWRPEHELIYPDLQYNYFRKEAFMCESGKAKTNFLFSHRVKNLLKLELSYFRKFSQSNIN